MTLYTNAAATALRLLTKFGQDITLRKLTPAVYDPSTGATTPGTSDTTRKGVLLDYDRVNFGETLQDGTLVTGADRRLLLDANGVAPTLADRIFTVGGNEWVIRDIKTLDPSGASPVLYDCRIRQ